MPIAALVEASVKDKNSGVRVVATKAIKAIGPEAATKSEAKKALW